MKEENIEMEDLKTLLESFLKNKNEDIICMVIISNEEKNNSAKEEFKESLINESNELFKKIKVLADRIRSYNKYLPKESEVMLYQYKAMLDYHSALKERIKLLEE